MGVGKHDFSLHLIAIFKMGEENSWREKYETLLHKTLKELEESSIKAQQDAELNLEGEL